MNDDEARKTFARGVRLPGVLGKCEVSDVAIVGGVKVVDARVVVNLEK